MDKKDSNLSRRKFIAAGSAAIAAPVIINMAGKVAEASAAEKTEATSAKKKKYIIDDNCCLCPPLRCKLFCPAGAVYFNGIHMDINQEKCIQCGTCFNNCPLSAVVDVTAPAPAVAPHDTIIRECDFVVIGGGMSGIVAAAAAADLSRKKVIVIERNKRAGGCGFFPIGTGLQKGGGMGPGGGMPGGMGGGQGGTQGGQAAGAAASTGKSAQDSLDDSIARAMSSSENLLNPRLIANFKVAQSALQEWLYSWADTSDIFSNMEKERSGRFITAIIDKAKKAGVEILTGTSATEFIVNGDGKITGVKAKDPGGAIQVNFKYCLISTGTVVNNTLIMARSAVPEYTNPWDIRTGHRYPYNTGDGVIMAEKAGIPIDWDNIFIHFTGVHSSLAESTTRILDHKADSLIVNLNGERFANETLLTDDFLPVLLKQPRNMLWHIMDSNIITSGVGKISSGSSAMGGMMGGGMAPQGGMPSGTGGSGVPGSSSAPSGMGGAQGGQGASSGMAGGMTAPAGMAGTAAGMTAPAGGQGGAEETQGFSQERVKDMAEFSYAPTASTPDMKEVERIASLPGRHICKASTLEELADKMGVDRKALLASIKRYNELCAKGHDDDFYKSKDYMVPIKKGPFYASSHFLGHDGAFGGLNINENGQVMGKNGPIPNLFASGDITSSNTVHHGSKRGGGISAEAGWAVCSGWLTAEYVSKQLKKG